MGYSGIGSFPFQSIAFALEIDDLRISLRLMQGWKRKSKSSIVRRSAITGRGVDVPYSTDVFSLRFDDVSR